MAFGIAEIDTHGDAVVFGASCSLLVQLTHFSSSFVFDATVGAVAGTLRAERCPGRPRLAMSVIHGYKSSTKLLPAVAAPLMTL